MKYVIIIPDGCADEPREELNGQTPLEAAKTPAMDAIAKQGIVGRANHTPDHLPAGSSVANMSLLGYSPFEFYTGRAPLEAAAQGIELARTAGHMRISGIGGEGIYREMLGIADRLLITEVDLEVEDADAFFPDFDESAWRSLAEMPLESESVRCTVRELIRR